MRLRLAALVLGLCLLSVSGVATVRAGQQRARGDQVRTLSGQAGDQAAALDASFERARTIDLLLARNDAFARAYSRSAAARRRAYGEQNAAMGYLQHLYPGRIAESCFIDQHGAEVSRVVAGEPAPRSELSTDEASNPFFHATFALRRGQVYQARPYLSPDTHTWVIANSTLLPVGRGAGRAIVHFEISLDSFRRQAAQSTPAGTRVQIVDADTRQLIVDTARPRPLGAPVGRLDERRYAALAGGATAGTMTLRGQTAAFHRVPRRTGNANRWYVVVSAAHAAGASWWTALGPANAAMIAAALLLLGFALTSFRAHQRTLREAALCDELTGLPNRAVFRDRVRQAVLASGRVGAFAAVLMIDLDRFKEVNDTLGHHKGDLLLQEVGARLREVLREGDTVARFGGDEFAILIPRIEHADQAAEVASRIAGVMEGAFAIDGVAVHVDASIGISLSPTDGEDPDLLVQRADIAMYEAKKGSADHAFYASERDPYSARRLAMVEELRAAIEARELEVHYQPKVDLRTGDVTGAEALVRWPHPEHGMISPGEFVPLAEQTGLIKPLTIAVLETALVQARRWRDDGLSLTVSVNLSARNLLDPLLPGEVDAMLSRYGVSPALLELEITESTIMSDPERALEVLTRLDTMGVKLSIDDFGTGYSSLAYLKRLPVDELKIDREFVMNMSTDRADAFIVRCAIDLARNLGLTVVAEGVEDEETVAALADIGCHAAQGFLFSRPVPAPELERWLAAGGAALPPSAR